MATLAPQYDQGITALALGISFIGSYMTISFCEQFRLCSLGTFQSMLLPTWSLFRFMALALGGVSIWSFNLIHTASLTLVTPDGTILKPNFSIYPIIITLVISLITAFIGLYISSKDKMFAKNKKEIVETFLEDAKKMSMKQIKGISNSKMLFLIATNSLWLLLSGGIAAGSGVAITSILVVKSMGIADCTEEYSISYIVLAIFMGWIGFTLTYFILFRLLSLYPHLESLRIFSAACMTGFVAMTHYSALSGVTYTYAPGNLADDNTNFEHTFHIPYRQAELITTICGVVFTFGLVIMALADLRSWLYGLTASLQRFEHLMTVLKKDPAQNDIITAYFVKHQVLKIDQDHSSDEINRNSTIVNNSSHGHHNNTIHNNSNHNNNNNNSHHSHVVSNNNKQHVKRTMWQNMWSRFSSNSVQPESSGHNADGDTVRIARQHNITNATRSSDVESGRAETSTVRQLPLHSQLMPVKEDGIQGAESTKSTSEPTSQLIGSNELRSEENVGAKTNNEEAMYGLV